MNTPQIADIAAAAFLLRHHRDKPHLPQRRPLNADLHDRTRRSYAHVRRKNMADLVPFMYGTSQVRTILLDGGPWFVAADLCTALTLRDTTSALKMVDPDDKRTLSRSEGPQFMRGFDARVQTVNLVNESGVYALIFQSNKPEAREIKRWITQDVLPAIRRTGRYGQAALSRRELAEYWADAEKRAEFAEQRATALEPDATAWQQLADATGDHSVRETAQILARAGIDTGQNRLFATLRELGWIDRTGEPYQTQITIGRLARRIAPYDHPHTGEPTLSVQVRITPKGVRWLHAHLSRLPLPFEGVVA